MKKYLKQLRQEIMLKSFDSVYKKEDIFEVWDQNHIEFEGSNSEFHNVASTLLLNWDITVERAKCYKRE